MENILDPNSEFNVILFDQVVQTALSGNSERKKEAETTLIRFKELPSSWTKVDSILKSSSSQQAKFIALQILEENVKCKWSIFDEEMKNGLRQYVFTYVVTNQDSSIILKKFNSILVDIVKKDWPRKWPTFVTDLISVSQSTSMTVSSNSLDILKMVNEKAFLQSEDITTAKKRLLRATLKNEYHNIFSFIQLILEYSETQELDEALLKNCLSCFCSFCKSMPPQFIFSTRIIEIILKHLNSPHSIGVLECLLEVVDLFAADGITDSGCTSIIIPSEIDQAVVLEKITKINDECSAFFKIYLEKFDNEAELVNGFSKFDDSEKLFVKALSRVFCSLYQNYFTMLPPEKVKNGLMTLKTITKIRDFSVFSIVFDTWAFLIKQFYLEYPLRTSTKIPQRRKEYTFILEAMIPIFISTMPRPEEVFIIVNDLGEIVKDKNIATSEIEFYRKMKDTFYYLSFCVETQLLSHLEKSISQFCSLSATESPDSLISNHSYDHLNRLCWTVGSIANALEEETEKDFFVFIIKSLLTICEIRHQRDEKAIVASNIIFIIGQYNRFLRFNAEFLYVVIKKLFEFMEEDYEGIKEMVCDNFLKIAESCPSQFYFKKNGVHFIDSIMYDLPGIKKHLDFYLQRIVIEALFIVIAIRPDSNTQVVTVLDCLTNIKLIDFDQKYLSDYSSVKAICHLFEVYSLGFKILPAIFHNFPIHMSLVEYYRNIAPISSQSSAIIKGVLLKLFIDIAEGSTDENFLKNISDVVLVDFQNSSHASIITLSKTIMDKQSKICMLVTNNSTSIILFLIKIIIVPSIKFVNDGDNNPEITIEFLKLMNLLVSDYYPIFLPLLMNSESYDSIMNSVLASLGCIKDISDHGLILLNSLFVLSFKNGTQAFFNRFFLPTLENILGLIFDKDTKQNHELQVDLFFNLIDYSLKIGPISQRSNIETIDEFIKGLFKSNFKNLTENSLVLFSKGMFEIKNKEEFVNHLNDFTVKIYEFGCDEDIQEDMEILQERITKIQ